MFLLYFQVQDFQEILKFSCWPLAFTSYKTLLKKKKSSGTSLSASCSAWFLKKNIYHVIYCQQTKFHYPTAFTSCDISQYVYCNHLFPGFNVINFNFAFLPSCFPRWPKNSGQKFKYLKNKKSFWSWIITIFHHF